MSAAKAKPRGDLRKLRLRYVAKADFRKNEATNLEEVLKERPEIRDLGPRDVIALRSGTGAQMVFVHGFSDLGETTPGHKRVALYSERMRLVTGQGRGWSELMLADYARDCGIELEGLKTLREHLEELHGKLKEEWTE